MDVLCRNNHQDKIGVPESIPNFSSYTEISGFRVNWETAIALSYNIMVLHKPFPFKIMACILNTIGECTNGVGQEQMENSFVSLKSEVGGLLCDKSVGCKEGDRGLVICLHDISSVW